MAYQAPTVSIITLYPGSNNLPSYFDVAITSQTTLNPNWPNGSTIYDAWCLDTGLKIQLTGYQASVYSSYELDVLRASPLGSNNFVVNYSQNLDNINWLLNYYDTHTTYTSGEMQVAIWKLIGQTDPTDPTLGPFSQANADTLFSLALSNGDGYLPSAGQTMGLILDPVNQTTGAHVQPLIITTKAAALGDFVWEDKNGNGIQDATEPGIAGVTVKLVRDMDNNGSISASEVLATTTTNASGLYSFIGLTPGLNYQVQFDQPAGYSVSPRQVDGSATSGTNSDGLLSNVVVLKPGENNTTIDAGFYKPIASLGDRLWVDTNGDGKQDTNTTLEPGVVGATVTLIGGGADGLINGVGDTVTTTTTGANGIYAFTGLTPGVQYQVQFTAPNGTVFTTPNVSANGFDSVDSDADKVTGKTQIVTLAQGENNTTLDAGVYAPAKLSGFVYQDVGNDGVRNNEPAIPNVTLTLTGTDNAGNAVTATTTTNGTGFYEFVGLAPGSYTVTETQPAAYIDGKDTVGSTGGSNAVNDKLSNITLTAGANSVENNFGELIAAGLGDRLWIDTDGDGKQSSDTVAEPGISGQVITLVGGGADGIINGIGDTTATTTTGGNGFYAFTGLTPGVEYQVQFTKPNGTVFTAPNVSANGFDNVDSDADKVTGKTQIVTLGQGEFNSTIDAGVYTPAKLSGYVYQDVGDDGVRNNEPAIPGTLLTLTGTDNAGNSVTATTTTNTAGFYEFVGLAPGKYTVSETQPAGYLDGKDTVGSTGGSNAVNDVLSNITLVAGANSTENNFGEIPTASLGDRLWVDTNGDGKQDTNTTLEPGVVGSVVTLIGGGVDGLISTTADNTTATTTTGANGIYAFTGLTPGVQYQVQFTAPNGSVFTAPNVSANGFDTIDSDADKVTGRTQIVTLAAGENNPTLDAGIYTPAQLSGYVYQDVGNDGIRNNEPAIPGTLLSLSGTDGAGNAVTATTTTDANGFYQFTGLAPGSYTVTETQPANYLDGKDTVGSTGGSNAVNDVLSSVTLVSGANSTENNFGELKPASLGDRLWVDTNGDGKQDTNTTLEPGVVGATVTLIGGGADGVINGVGDTTTTTTTGANGIYAFTGLTPGVQYQVQFAAPNGTVFTAPNVSSNGFDTVDSDADKVTGKTQVVTLAQGENNTTLDAGVYTPGKLTGFVYVDSNDDGSRAGEAPIQGVTLTLSGTDGAGNPVTGTTTTDGSGFYQFTNLAPGSYTVSETQPAAYNDGKDTIGTTGGSNAVNDVLSSIPVVSGGVSNENNFGELVPKARLGDFLFEDTNGNGIQDLGEAGIGGVTVSLKNSTGTVIATTTTSATGLYGFDVTPGTYSVQFGTPAGGYVFTKANAGADDAKDSDVDATGNTGQYTIAAGQTNLTIDAGVYKTAAIGDRIWYDKNANGIQDTGETNIANVKVDLYDNGTGAIIGTQTTDANGLYLFSNLAPGSYHVDVQEATLPAGFIFTRPNQGADDAADSDVETLGGTVPLSWGAMANTTLTSGELDRTWDAGVYKIGIDVEKYVSGTKTVCEVKGGTEGADCNSWKNSCQSTTTSTWGITGYFLGIFPQYGWINTTTMTGWTGINQCKASDSFNTVFGVNCAGGTKSLYDILCGTGTTAIEKMQRECVSAYLNACHNKVDYTFTPEQVCAEVKNAVSCGDYDRTCNLFSCENVKGCDWNTDCTKTTTVVDTTLYDADSPPGLEVKAGSLVTFTYIVKNTGDTPLSNITLTDDRIQTVTYVSGDTNNNGLLDLTETWTYKASETAQSGTIKNIGTVVGTDSVGGVSKVTDNDPAYYTGTGALKSSIGDRVWFDKDADGVQDNGETGISGVVVTLKGAGTDGVFGNADDITAVTTTNANGNYLFPNLAAGKYQVEFGAATGYVRTAANVGANDAADSDADATGKTGVINLLANQQDLSVDAGYVKPGIDVEKYVSGTKTTTTNNCGGEGANCNWWKTNCVGGTTWTGLTCKGTDTFGSIFGVTCTGSTKSLYTILCGTSTAAYDVWQRECVAAYLNSCHDKVNYSYTKDQVCSDVKYAVTCGDYSNCGIKFAFENNQGCSFTSTKSTYSCTVDTQLYDADSPPGLEVKTGSLVTFTYIVKNTGPVALKDVVLTDDRIATVTYVSGDTNNNGLLDVTETWTYKASESASAGTIKNTGTVTAKDAGTGSVVVTDKDDAYYTGSGAVKSSLGDRLWIDKDADGLQEVGEVGLGGIKVVLKGAGKDGLFGTADDITATTTTSSTGAYLFQNLDAGKYQLDFSDALTKGWQFTKYNVLTDIAANSDAKVADGLTDVYDLAADQQRLTIDAGVYQKACVGDKVWEDKNHNGIQDLGEGGVGGIKVQLLNSATLAVMATTTTNASGNYQFTGLEPGSYVLQFDKTNVIYSGINMNTWKWGVKDVGADDGADSDVAGNGVLTTNITKTDAFVLVSGQSDQSRDAAITPLVIDLDGNGIHTVSLANSAGTFDLLGNGTAIKSGWISAGDAFLAVDKDSNGSIDSVNELFGGTAKGAGFAALASYDSNHDGLVDAADADFAKLLVWQDLNGDHQSSADELRTLAQAGIASLTVANTDLQFLDAQGNVHGEASSVTTVTGATLGMTDIYFAVDADVAGKAALPSVSELLGSNTLDSLVGTAEVTTDVSRMQTEAVCDSDGGEALRRLAALHREELTAA